MISAKEAKDAAKKADTMANLLEEVEAWIEEAAEEGEMEVDFPIEDLEDFKLQKLVEILTENGYMTKPLKKEEKDYDEDTNTYHRWEEPYLKISWRMA